MILDCTFLSEVVTVDSAAVSVDSGDAANQLKAMRKDLDALKNRKEELHIDEALATVRTLASRPKLTSPNVLLAAVEILAEAANKANYKDATMFSKSLSICKKYEEHEDLCSLVLKLFGTQEDKKISSLITEWKKTKRYEGEKEKEKVKENVTSPSNPYNVPGFGFPQPYPMYYGYPPVMYPGPQCQGGSNFYGPRVPMRGGRTRKPRSNMSCYFCKETGHFVSSCPTIKKD